MGPYFLSESFVLMCETLLFLEVKGLVVMGTVNPNIDIM